MQTVTLSHNYLNNRNLKYLRNDDSSEDNLTLRLRSVEQKTTLRAENRTYLGRWTVREGVEVNYSDYTNRTLQRLYTDRTQLSDYRTRLTSGSPPRRACAPTGATTRDVWRGCGASCRPGLRSPMR